jgi:uncharacterized protein YuzE
MNKMKMTYDSEIDALYIEFSDEPIADSVEYLDGIIAELDANGRMVALEILDLHHYLKVAEQALDAALAEDEEIVASAGPSG